MDLSLLSENYFYIFCFITGIITALSPCTLPVIPLSLSVIEKKNKFLNTLFFILGIVVSFTIIGVLVYQFKLFWGEIFGFSKIRYLLFFVILFLLLNQIEIFKFNFFNKLQNTSNKIKIGNIKYIKPFLFGLTTGLVSAPCVGPGIAIILGLVVDFNFLQTLFSFFIFSLGFSSIFLIVNIIGNKFNNISKYYDPFIVFSYLFLLYLFKPNLIIFGIILILLAIFSIYKKKYFILILSLAFIGLGLTNNKTDISVAQTYNKKFTLIKFDAEWCFKCKIINEKILNDKEFESLIKENFNYKHIDVTEVNKENKEILDKFQVKGLPTILITDLEDKVLERYYDKFNKNDLINFINK